MYGTCANDKGTLKSLHRSCEQSINSRRQLSWKRRVDVHSKLPRICIAGGNSGNPPPPRILLFLQWTSGPSPSPHRRPMPLAISLLDSTNRNASSFNASLLLSHLAPLSSIFSTLFLRHSWPSGKSSFSPKDPNMPSFVHHLHSPPLALHLDSISTPSRLHLIPSTTLFSPDHRLELIL